MFFFFFSGALIPKVSKNWGTGKMWALRDLIMRKGDHWEWGCVLKEAKALSKLAGYPSRGSHDCSHHSLFEISSKKSPSPSHRSSSKPSAKIPEVKSSIAFDLGRSRHIKMYLGQLGKVGRS